jgi:hypothetical protein
MLNEFSPLPVRCELADDESGHSFLLRSARANGIGLAELFAHAGGRSIKWPHSPDIEALAFLTSVPPSVLALRVRQRHSRGQEIAYGGERWRGSEMFRVKVPQICALCIRELGRCLAVWELSAYCVCVQHRAVMTDYCAHCKRSLSWLRPALDLCACGRYLSQPVDVHVVPEDARTTELCRWLEGNFSKEQQGQSKLPTWLTGLGGDGVVHLLRALGWRTHPGERISAADAIKVISPLEMLACIDRAFSKISAISEDQALPRAVSDILDEARLERMAANGVSETARRFAGQLLKRMQLKAPLTQLYRPWRAARPPKGQLELFDDV